MFGVENIDHSVQKPFANPAPSVPGVQWCAVQTRSRHERKVHEQLLGRELESYLPLLPQIHRWSDRNKRIETPLFSGYVFVRLCPTSASRLSVLQAPGAVRFVSFGSRLAQIPDKQIEDIRLIVERKIPCVPHPFPGVGQRVRIRGGCLEGVEGVLVTLNSDASIVVSIGAIQRSVAIRVHGYDIEAA